MDKDLTENDTVDGMKICNYGFEFQNATHAENVKQYKAWLDDLVQL